MRLLFVIDCLGSGGAQRQLVTLAQGLAGRGHRCEFFVYHPELDYFESSLVEAGIPVHKCAKRRGVDLGVIGALRSRALQGDHDLVISFLDGPNLYAELALLGKAVPALIVSERSTYPESGPSTMKRLLEHAHRLARCVTVNSHYQETRMLEFSPWLRGRTRVIYNGLDLDRFRPARSANDSRTLLAVGSVIPVKNALGLVHALAAYRRIYGEPPTVHWAGAVYPAQWSQAEYVKVNKLLEEERLADKWLWLGERKDMASLYGQYPGLIHPSFLEGLPNAVCEAMASGLPVLASAVCEHPRLVGEGERGYLFAPDQPVDIARAIHDFFALSQSAKLSMSAACRRFAAAEFGIPVFLDRYEQLFLDLTC